MTTTDRQIAFLPAIRKIRACPIYFDGVKFSTTQKTCAQKFDTVALLQAAITQAYKNGTVSADEINAYCSVRAPRVPDRKSVV